MSRPKKSAAERHDKVVSTKHTVAQLRQLKALAAKAKMGICSYATQLLHMHLAGEAHPWAPYPRVKLEDRPGMPQFGVLVGLLIDEHGATLAVVRLEYYGLMLKALHPSKVTPVTPEEEATYKP